MYRQRATRERGKLRERKRARISRAECGMPEAVLSLKGHIERQHGRSVPQTREVEIGVGGGYQLPTSGLK